MKMSIDPNLCLSRYNGDPTIGTAIRALVPDAEFVIRSSEDEQLEWLDKNDSSCPDIKDIENKLNELRDNHAVEVLRKERNKKLAETDWMSLPDAPKMTAKWKSYRQELRDLTSTADPKLNEYGVLTNVTWPTEPE
tara:strand:+ start:580 stop:987 length:408 start_codon:yes stop_codon:yes gene_type:complete